MIVIKSDRLKHISSTFKYSKIFVELYQVLPKLILRIYKGRCYVLGSKTEI